MSLVSTYAQGDDELYYQNPVLSDGWGWYICLDGRDPIELVTLKNSRSFRRRNIQLDEVVKLMNDCGFKVSRISKKHRTCNRLFPPDYEKFYSAVSAFLNFKTSPIPTKYIIEHDGTVTANAEGRPLRVGDCCFYPAKEIQTNWRDVKKERLYHAKSLLLQFERHTEWHYSTYLRGSKLDYWPTTNKWRWEYKNYLGGSGDLLKFLKKRGWKGD